jgi:shikimate kinase
MKIVLTGMRGTGKTTLGKILSSKLNYPYADMDEMIEKKANMPIKQIIEKEGWDFFRDMEHEVAESFRNQDRVVISTGGGALMYDRNLRPLAKNALVVHLYASLTVLEERIKGDDNRPSLGGVQSSTDELFVIWEERKDRYAEISDLSYDTGNGLNPKDQADEILALLLEQEAGLI